MTRDLWRAALRPGPECPPLEELAELAAGRLAGRGRLREHTRRCAHCAGELALLEAWEEEPPVPGRRSRPALALLAAGVVLAVCAGTLYQLRTPTPALPDRLSAAETLRSNTILAAGPEGDLDAAPAKLQWEAVASAARYRVTLMEVDRTVLWQAESQDTSVVLPAAVRALCLPAKTLLWRVHAVDASGRALADSEVARFRVRPAPGH